ncbi:MAG TPA: aminodeoxychorismate synthase, component I, partial [Verrucomicrobiae bacterium]|nr:aminodeoxychorismate synthase, component I [Verrucomicrobiae bacterium]
MRPLILETATNLSPEDLVSALLAESAPGIVLLRSGGPFSEQARYSFVAARPFLSFRSLGSRCESSAAGRERVQFGNPWHVLDSLMQRYEMIDSLELPFPLGGCFGYWGYDLKNFVEPKLPRVAVNDLEIPDAVVGFYDSIAAFDHHLGKSWIISTGLNVEGERDAGRAEAAARFWQSLLGRGSDDLQLPLSRAEWQPSGDFVSTLCREAFIDRVRAAQEYIRKGDIYQVNLAHRLEFQLSRNPW